MHLILRCSKIAINLNSRCPKLCGNIVFEVGSFLAVASKKGNRVSKIFGFSIIYINLYYTIP